MKNRTREICTSGTVRDEGGNILIYSANDRGDRGNVGIIRSPIRASILPDRLWTSVGRDENMVGRLEVHRFSKIRVDLHLCLALDEFRLSEILKPAFGSLNPMAPQRR